MMFVFVRVLRSSSLTIGKRYITTKPTNYFEIFPKTFKEDDISKSDLGFSVDAKQLRKEYRKLQALNHPDLNNQLNNDSAIDKEQAISSSLINKAYETLSDPLKRAQYIISLNSSLELDDDEAGKRLQFQDKQMLMEMMDIHERLEEIMDQKELDDMKQENNEKIDLLIKELSEAFKGGDLDLASMKAVRLKYCYNIKNALKNWAPGNPVTLTH